MKGRLFGLMMAFALVAGLPATAFADDAAEGEYVAEIEAAGEYAYYSFTPEESGYYAISASSDSDTYGYLYDADWNLILEADDTASSYDAQLVAYLEAGQTYYAAFGYYDSAETGSFTVSVSPFDMGTLSVGDSVLVAVDPAAPYAYYSFTAEAAGSYTFYTEGAADTYVYLYDSAWNLVNYDDDSAGNYNAKINVALEEGETCYLVFCLYDEDDSGEFAVIAQETAPETVVLGDSYSVTIDTGEVLFCAVVPEETGVYAFYTTGDADTYLCLYDADWGLVNYDDDSAEDYNAMLSAVLVAGETYYLSIDLYDSSESAEFVLVTEQLAIAELDEAGANVATIGAYGLGTYFVYTPAESGLYTFTATAAGGYSGVFVYDAEWNLLGEAYVGEYSYDYDDDYYYYYFYDDEEDVGTTTVALAAASISSNDLVEDADAESGSVTLALAAGETYYLELAYSVDDVPTSLSVAVEACEAEVLAAGDSISVSLGEGGEVAYYVFTTETAALYAFTTSGDCDTYITIYDATGAVVAEDDDSGDDYNASASAFLEAEQTYYLAVYLYDTDEAGKFKLEVTQTAVDGQACVAYIAEGSGLCTFALVGADGEDLTDELAVYDSTGALVETSGEDGAAQVVVIAGETYYAVISEDAVEAGMEIAVSLDEAVLAGVGDAVAVAYDYSMDVLVADYTLAIEESGPVELVLEGTVEGAVQLVVIVYDEALEYVGYSYAVIELEESDSAESAVVADVVTTAGGTYLVEVLVYGEGETAAADLVLSVQDVEIVALTAVDSDAIPTQGVA